jgi:metal-dependent HD superfamily phosphatase/phosphodiesterase
MVTFEEIRTNEEIRAYIDAGNEVLGVLGYTEHHFAHAQKVAISAGQLLLDLGYSEREAELARIAGFMHDMGNMVSREEHNQNGAIIAFQILNRLGMDPKEIAQIVGAIGNHDEGTGVAVSVISAALILADKSDVRRSRVRSKAPIITDIHNRVNYAVNQAEMTIDRQTKTAILELVIDTSICPVIEYFEIFLDRMLMCRSACNYLDIKFQLIINKIQYF